MAKSGHVKITQNSQSIPNNNSNITVSGVIVTTGESYRGDQRTGTYTIKQGSTTIKTGSFTHGAPENSTTTLFTVTLNVSHKANGTSDKITASYDYDSGWCTGNGSLSLTTIPRQATITAAPNFTDEDNPEITYSNKAGNSVSTLQACIASTNGQTIYVPYRDISKTGTSYTFNFTDAEREALQKACVNARSMDVRFYVKTVIAGVTYYSSIVKKLTIANAEPTLEVSVEDVNATTIALTGDKNRFVKYISNAKYVMTASALKGATIKSYNVNCGDKSSTSSSGTINAVESGTFVFTVTDSRGYTKTVTLGKTLVSYVPLTCVLVTKPPNAEGNMNFSVTGTAYNGSFGSKSNEISVQYRYKSEDDDSYGAWTNLGTVTFSSGKYVANGSVAGLDYTKQYTFQARIVDSISTAVSKEYNIRVLPVFYWGKDRFFFNVPVDIMGGQISDFVVENGFKEIGNEAASNNYFYYRNWNSGDCDMWLRGHVKYTVGDAESDGYRPCSITIPLPIELNTHRYAVHFHVSNSADRYFIPGYIEAEKGTVTLYWKQTSSSNTGYLHLQIKGRWKS